MPEFITIDSSTGAINIKYSATLGVYNVSVTGILQNYQRATVDFTVNILYQASTVSLEA